MTYTTLNAQKSRTIISNQKYLLEPVAESFYTCKDWKKDPKIWGPHLWAYLHYSAANYPEHPTESEIQEMIHWLCSLPVTIPCVNCSKHYRKYIEDTKPYLYNICSNKESLFNFLVDIHNKVNIRNGKPEMTYDQARKIY